MLKFKFVIYLEKPELGPIMPYIKHYRYTSFWEWIRKLTAEGFLRVEHSENQDTCWIKTPVQIILTKDAVERIKRRYKYNSEIGGILLVQPVKRSQERLLIVKHIRFIENLSKNDVSSPRRYTAKGDTLLSMHKCLMGRKDKTRYFPIWFHSHPRQGNNESSEILLTFFCMSTSEGDKKCATREITYSLNARKVTFKFPSALVLVSKERYLFLGIYGGGVAPNEFKAYTEKLLSQSSRDFINWTESTDSFWETLAGIVGAISMEFLMAFNRGNSIYSALANQAVVVIKDQKTDHNYFSLSKDSGDLKIILP